MTMEDILCSLDNTDYYGPMTPLENEEYRCLRRLALAAPKLLEACKAALTLWDGDKQGRAGHIYREILSAIAEAEERA